MSAPRPSLCITCGLDAGPVLSLNRTEDGRACPSCAERLLDLLPPPFPGFGHMIEVENPRARGRGTKAGPKSLDAEAKRSRRGRKQGPE